MGLINESQRKKANVEPNSGNLPTVKPADVEAEVQQLQTPEVNSQESTDVSQQEIEFTNPYADIPTSENLPVPAGIGLTESTLQEQFTNTADQQISGQQFRSELNPNPRTTERIGLYESLPDPFGGQQPPELSGFSAPPVNQPLENVPLTSLFTNVRQQGISPYAPEVVNSQLPTIYETTPDLSSLSAARRSFQGDINRFNAEQKQAEIDTLDKVNFARQALDTLVNTPDIDKPWHQSFTGFLGDVAYGREQAQRRTEQGNFDFGAGEFGRAGAGIGGFLKYTLNLTTDLPVAVVGEVNRNAANLLQNFGVDKQTSENLVRNGVLGLIPGVPKFSDFLGFNFDAANKQGNLIGRALVGDNVGDLGDPRESTETNTGRVYFSPRRKPGQAFYEDPLGTAFEVAANLFNPVDDLNPVGRVIGAGLGVVTKKAGQILFRRSPKITPEITQATEAPKYRSIVNTPAAANPVKVTRVETGTTGVSQRLLPPVFDPALVPPANLKPALTVPKSNPAQTVLNIGIGSPGLRLTDLGELNLRPYTSIVNQLQQSSPRLLDNYAGTTWAELKSHLSQFSDVDVSELGVVGSKLTDDVLTRDDLATAAQELAAYKQFANEPLQKLDELFADTVDFGRKADESLGYRPYTLDEVVDTLDNGGLPAFHPKAYDSLPDNLRQLLQRGDYEGFITSAKRVGEDPDDLLSQVTDANNTILSTPVPVSVAKPTKVLTQLPPNLYHGTALAEFTPAYNLSVNGSRGELGSGLYLTNSQDVATDYALARVSENVNPNTLDLDLQPSVYQLTSTLDRTLDARAKLPSTDGFFTELTEGLPSELLVPLKSALSKGKTATYNSFLTKVESSLPKAGLEPAEANLQSIQQVISNNLRRLGYDSVYDGKSGFALVLDETKVSSASVQRLAAPTVDLAAISRYNADAYASKFYPERLTTDANLRDSTAKVLNQLKARVDDKLSEVQQQLIDRSDEVDGILPELTEELAQTSKPKSAQEALAELGEDGLCG